MTVWILVLHIAVLGYWLGSELVINSTYRYVSYAGSMPFNERQRLMDHVMIVDQHVRYALVLQAMLGTMLAASYGLVPGGETVANIALAIGIAWLAFVEAVHRLHHSAIGQVLVTQHLALGKSRQDLQPLGQRMHEVRPACRRRRCGFCIGRGRLFHGSSQRAPGAAGHRRQTISRGAPPAAHHRTTRTPRASQTATGRTRAARNGVTRSLAG